MTFCSVKELRGGGLVWEDVLCETFHFSVGREFNGKKRKLSILFSPKQRRPLFYDTFF